MKRYLSYYSAAAFWDIPFLNNVLDSVNDEIDKIEFTMSERSTRAREKGITTHLCKLALPAGAVVKRDGFS